MNIKEMYGRVVLLLSGRLAESLFESWLCFLEVRQTPQQHKKY